MKPAKAPLFVAPRIYRQRRLRDAARMLPIFGAVLMLVPFLHAPGGTRWTGSDGIYLFLVWAGLIALARLLAPGLDRAQTERDDDPDA